MSDPHEARTRLSLTRQHIAGLRKEQPDHMTNYFRACAMLGEAFTPPEFEEAELALSAALRQLGDWTHAWTEACRALARERRANWPPSASNEKYGPAPTQPLKSMDGPSEGSERGPDQ